MICEKTVLGVSPSDSTLVMLRPVMLIVVVVVVVESVDGSSDCSLVMTRGDAPDDNVPSVRLLLMSPSLSCNWSANSRFQRTSPIDGLSMLWSATHF
jgi:hypothetical protein